MITPQTQVKLNLSVNLKDFLEAKARKFGMPMSDYLKHLILKDIEDEEYPTFEASEATEQATKRALREIDKSIVINNSKDLKDFFKGF